MNNFPDVWSAKPLKAERCNVSITLPSKSLRSKAKEKAEYLEMSLSRYVSWLIEKDLMKDPRKQWDRLHRDK